MMKCKRSFLSTVLLMLAILLLFTTAKINCNAASKVRLSSKKVVLVKGGSKKLTLKNAEQKKVRWKSSDKSVVSVNKNGKITAKKKGTARITARYRKKKYVCKVTVKDPVKTKSNAKLNRTSLGITKGKKATVSVIGAKGKITSCKVTSSSIASVKRSGSSKVIITGKKSGHTKLQVKVDGKTLSCDIKVSNSFNYTQIEKNNKAVADKITVKVETSLQYPEMEREIRDNVSIPGDRKTFDTVKITITNHYSKSVKLTSVALSRNDGQEMIGTESIRGKKNYYYRMWEKPTTANTFYPSYVFYDADTPGNKGNPQGYLIVPAGATRSITYCMHIPETLYSKEYRDYCRSSCGEEYLSSRYHFEVIREKTLLNLQVIASPYTSSNWSNGKGPGMVSYQYRPYSGQLKMDYYN